MLRLEPGDFPNLCHECYESSMMNILLYMGLPDELPLMTTHSYFVFDEDVPNVYSRATVIGDEWRHKHGLEIKILSVSYENDLRKQLVDKLNNGIPVCLPVDIYFLPYTSYYHRFHGNHYLNIFGYSDDQYYVVCPYYRYIGWIDMNMIHAGLFSPINPDRNLIFIPQIKWKTLSLEQMQNLIHESCEYMLGFATPEELIGQNPKQLGLRGISALSTFLRKLLIPQDDDLHLNLLELSTQIVAIGYSRYWLHQLIQSYRPSLLSAEATSHLDELFSVIIPAWRAIGMRFGAAIHAQDNNIIGQIAGRLDDLNQKEYRLFNYLRGVLSDYEDGEL